LVGGFGDDRRDSAAAQAGAEWRGRSKPVGADAMRAGVWWVPYLIFDLREDIAA
jgi:2-hydroxychromene-2-carboxylate isomerase